MFDRHYMPEGLNSDSDTEAYYEEVLDERYIIKRKLGEGAAGAVFEAEHLLIRRPVAIKILNAHYSQDPQMVSLFQQEAQTSGSLDHPNICRALDFGQTERAEYFLVMEYIDGINLAQELKAKGSLEPIEALDTIAEVAKGLRYAHQRGVVHRDLKPENIMRITKTGEVKITDFGIARLTVKNAEEFLHSTMLAKNKGERTTFTGTRQYMSPEQIIGEDLQSVEVTIDQRSDLYSLGVILFELLVGTPPFISENPSMLMGYHLTDTPPTLDEKGFVGPTEPLQKLLNQLLTKVVKERIPDADHLLIRIEEVKQEILGPPLPLSEETSTAEDEEASEAHDQPSLEEGESSTPLSSSPDSLSEPSTPVAVSTPASDEDKAEIEKDNDEEDEDDDGEQDEDDDGEQDEDEDEDEDEELLPRWLLYSLGGLMGLLTLGAIFGITLLVATSFFESAQSDGTDENPPAQQIDTPSEADIDTPSEADIDTPSEADIEQALDSAHSVIDEAYVNSLLSVAQALQ